MRPIGVVVWDVFLLLKNENHWALRFVTCYVTNRPVRVYPSGSKDPVFVLFFGRDDPEGVKCL